MVRVFRNPINIFAEENLNGFLENRKKTVISKIEAEKESVLLNCNETEYIKKMVLEAHIENLDIDESNITMSSYERLVPANSFPISFGAQHGKSYKRQVIKFHLPFIGDASLLLYRPSQFTFWSMKLDVLDNELCFEFIQFYDDMELIKREKDSVIRGLSQQLKNVRLEVEVYNSTLDAQMRSAFEVRKSKIKDNSNFLSSFNIPIKKNTNSNTFSIPKPQLREKITFSQPEINNSGAILDPVLNIKDYQNILKIINDVGKEFERLPSLYSGKDEENLRDHILMVLQPNIEGSATGETFNKSGKTDILLRFNNSNVFIAECKFWHGQKILLDTVSQLLNYLTWRDSKAAIIIFVQNKEISEVINKAKIYIEDHPNFLRYVIEYGESWFEYEFHLNGDKERIIKIAMMLYHIPKN